MDCAPLIRTKSLLAVWVAVPLLMLCVIVLGTRGFYDQQRIACEKKKMLAEMIPRMQAEAEKTKRFLETFHAARDKNISVQDLYIGLLYNAGAESGFIIETLSVDKTPLEGNHGTIRMVMKLGGNGTCRQIADFLNQIKQADPLIVENRLMLSPSRKDADMLKVKSELIKIYVESTDA